MLSFVAYFETLLQLSLHLCQFTKCLFSVFLHIEAQLCVVTPSFLFGFQ